MPDEDAPDPHRPDDAISGGRDADQAGPTIDLGNDGDPDPAGPGTNLGDDADPDQAGPGTDVGDEAGLDPAEADPERQANEFADDGAPVGKARRGSGWGGCALWAVAALVIVIGGCAVGLALRPGHGFHRVADGNGWTLQARVDPVTKLPCLSLVDPSGTQLTGQCQYSTAADPDVPAATWIKVRTEYVIFAPVPPTTAAVRLHLVDGTTHLATVKNQAGVHYFVYVSGSANKGPTVLLDAAGHVVPPPSK